MFILQNVEYVYNLIVLFARKIFLKQNISFRIHKKKQFFEGLNWLSFDDEDEYITFFVQIESEKKLRVSFSISFKKISKNGYAPRQNQTL